MAGEEAARFVHRNQVVIPIVWPEAKRFEQNVSVTSTVDCSSSNAQFEVDHGIFSIRFQKVEPPSPPTIIVSSPKRFTVSKIQVLFSSPSGFKIVSHRSTASGSLDEQGNRRCEDEGYFAVLKVWKGTHNPTPKSIIALHAELHVRFAEVDVQSAKSLSSDLLRLYHTQDGVDVSFTFKDEPRELGAHKWLLCARSEYFRRMFDAGGQKSTDPKFPINDFDSGIFEKVLVYLYSGDSSDIADKDSLLTCLRLADEYSLSELKQICVLKINNLLCVENVIEISMAIHRTDCDVLLGACFHLLSCQSEHERWAWLIKTGSFELMNEFVRYLKDEEA